MAETTIPATYAGGISYSLAFQQTENGLQVRRSGDDVWKPVVDLKASPLDRDPERVLVEINGDLTHGAPIFSWMLTHDWETVRGMKG